MAKSPALWHPGASQAVHLRYNATHREQRAKAQREARSRLTPAERRARDRAQYLRGRTRALVRRAVQSTLHAGTLMREPCLFCGTEVVEAHHHDYSQPLAVTWLCSRHHKIIHRRLP